MHSSNTGLSGKILLWGQISPIILFAGRGGTEGQLCLDSFPAFHSFNCQCTKPSTRVAAVYGQQKRACWLKAKPDLIWSVLQLSVLAGQFTEREVWAWFPISLLRHARTHTNTHTHSTGWKKKLTVKLAQVTKQHSQKFSCGWNASVMTNRGTKKQVLRLKCHLLQTAGCLHK